MIITIWFAKCYGEGRHNRKQGINQGCSEDGVGRIGKALRLANGE